MTENTNAPTTLTDEEQDLVRRSAFSAIALVSKADPGFFSMFKESMAGSRAFAEAPAGVQQLLREGGFPTPPTGSPEQVESTPLDLDADYITGDGALTAELLDRRPVRPRTVANLYEGRPGLNPTEAIRTFLEKV